MKLAIAILLVLVASCTSKTYSYKASLNHPIKSERLFYENDTLSIAFTLIPKAIKIEVYNKLNDGLKISWDELSFSVNGKAQRIVHKETGTFKISEVQPPTTIPPRSKLTDGLIPTDHIHYTSGKVSVTDVFPKYDYGRKKVRKAILAMKGQKITIYFPYYVGGKYVGQYYDLVIDDVITGKEKAIMGPTSISAINL